ncbi:YidB family protein [Streptomyces sp. NPDC059278]|uniref:YidB family protein n=1 Tax=Streptomyces sp. NPDC059278 TaxID=3346801 RepID=UPI0036C85227
MADEVLPQFSSWLGDGPNEPVTPGQVTAALGDEHLAGLAQASGLDQSAVAEALAKKLPSFVDSVSPEGRIDQGLVRSRSLSLDEDGAELDVLSQTLDGFNDWLLEQDGSAR